MAPAVDSLVTDATANYSFDERGLTPPAFLDLADSGTRLGSNMPHMAARVEQKRIEHERQRLMHRKKFEDQMRALEVMQAMEERQLLSVQGDATSQHMAISAPTTPPRVSSVVNGAPSPGDTPTFELDQAAITNAVVKANKRKSVTYAPSVTQVSDTPSYGSLHPHSFSRPIGAKSMPASRRTSASSQELEELSTLTLQALSLNEKADRTSPHAPPKPSALRKSSDDRGAVDSPYNAGLLLDDELDKEMHNAMRYLPVAHDDEKFTLSRTESYPGRLSVSSAALDLAPLSQTPPRSSFVGRTAELAGKSSEWPQFSGRAPDSYPMRPERHRTSTTPIGVGIPTQSKLTGAVSASATPNIPIISPDTSRRSSPPGLSDGLTITSTRSVPATPLTGLPNARPDLASFAKTPGTPLAPGSGNPEVGPQYGRQSVTGNQSDRAFSATDLSATLSRLTANSPYESAGSYSSLQHSPDDQQPYGVDSVYGIVPNSFDSTRYGYGFEQGSRVPSGGSASGGSTALYHHHGTRYGLTHAGLGGRMPGPDSKMNGLHGPKHKRGDMDREFNRFAGTRIEDLQGEIPQLCKDQHGCRYLQKKLEEGIPEHRDMIFRETFGHFTELMTDPFGNYLCQKLVEFSTDEQRNFVCESVAQDLVTISLNMHGTRAVQKLIDFLSTPRQIHAIILALSMHVVTLIKDLNGNHVIQKCLNKLMPEDNQFIYNAVAQNCVEVATHRHGCCVLQRCIDHASDNQRVQLVQEITYNALTLVQDPYGNYVVQYILDLNDNRFSDGVIRQFTGNVCALSVQKFSSNVIEKCIRVAEPSTRKLLIEELLNRSRLEKLLRDSFGNYCVQTALDYADPQQRIALVEGIRPILPLIRNTPYGKRIQSKLQREQMEAAQIGGGHFSGYQPVMFSATGGGGFSGVSHGARQVSHSMHPSAQMAEIYATQSSMYSNGVPLQQATAQTPQMHSSQLHAGGLQHSSIDPYILQNAGFNQSLGSSSAAFGGFAAGAFGNNMGLNDNQYARPGFHYAM